MAEITLQIHEWPWSFVEPSETLDIADGETAELRYYGSPILTLAEGGSARLAGRYEPFRQSGQEFKFEDGYLRILQVPHAFLMPLNEGEPPVSVPLIVRDGQGERLQANFMPRYAVKRRTPVPDGRKKPEDSLLYAAILSWSAFFDDLSAEEREKFFFQGVPWQEVLRFIEDRKNEGGEPRKSLIVEIAEKVRDSLKELSRGARRFLLRKREKIPAARIEEMDAACITWYMRQPGRTPVEKAAGNGQRLMGVTRVETFNTLENRVLKDFVARCSDESWRYERAFKSKSESGRVRTVKSFRYFCDAMRQLGFFSGIQPVTLPIVPNYVLQSDARYKEIWKYYLKFLRREDVEDSLWAWQSRTWEDVANLMLNCALLRLHDEQDESFSLSLTAVSRLFVLPEQDAGRRLKPGCETGPYVLSIRDAQYLVNIVRAEDACLHPSLPPKISQTGASLFLVFRPVSGGTPKAVAVWPVHTAASENVGREKMDKEWRTYAEIRQSAENALGSHEGDISRRTKTPVRLNGLVICSSLEENPGLEEGDRVSLACLRVQAAHWAENIRLLAMGLRSLLEKTL